MSREAHVQFWEGLAVRLRWATRLSARLRDGELGKERDRRYLEFYNSRRQHSSLDGSTPDAFYFANLPALKQAA